MPATSWYSQSFEKFRIFHSAHLLTLTLTLTLTQLVDHPPTSCTPGQLGDPHQLVDHPPTSCPVGFTQLDIPHDPPINRDQLRAP
jgi:hypothetical protein